MEDRTKTTDELLELLRSKKNFDEYLREEPEYIEADLAEYMEGLMEERGLKKADVIRDSQLDRTYAYQIFSGMRRPNRDKVVAIGIAMGLPVEEMQRLLRIAGHPPLYVKNRRDSVILFAVDKQVSLGELNELLYDLHENIVE